MSSYLIEVFYDGACPICVREIRALMRLDRRRGRIRFTDIADPGFDAASLGVEPAELMREIHGRLPSGEWVRGVEVFRRLYAAVGLGAVVALTRLPGISGVVEAGYALFARNRLRLTGRCTAELCGAGKARTPA